MLLHVSSTCAHHQEVKIALHSLWYHHTYRWPSRTRCDDTRGCVMQFWPPDDEHMCSKHVEAWNKLIVKQKFCVSSWLITKLNILRCTVSKTSKKCVFLFVYDNVCTCRVGLYSAGCGRPGPVFGPVVDCVVDVDNLHNLMCILTSMSL